MKFHIPRRVAWFFSVGAFLGSLFLLALLLLSVVRRERALRDIPLDQPEIVPELHRQDLEDLVLQTRRASEPLPPVPSPTSSPSLSP